MTLAAPIEAILLAAGEPVPLDRLAEGTGAPEAEVRAALAALAEAHAARDGGLQIVEIAGGWRIATRPEQAEAVERALRRTRKVRLTRAALETLSIIAYRQPATRAEIEEIRGVNVDGVMKTLLERGLVRIAGQKDEPGTPLLYRTTQEFLLHFGLRSVEDLPPLRELEEIAAAAGEGEEAAAPEDLEREAAEARDRLRALAEAAERELGDVEERLKGIKSPRLAAEPPTDGTSPPAEEPPPPADAPAPSAETGEPA